ncbi:hypothetical protein LC087_12670 [Bacillus carboniphilus]|uniref:Phage protein n=1 Tax=Bacillus carboniphilus TaxID=86663 RepID=A0ABY9JQV8_9BACI|nr:hypothetical protein [Bacillus carboniphilus]WLR41712.1 hypothetical protein LC087_12670 [Bacillus carboniphilus]
MNENPVILIEHKYGDGEIIEIERTIDETLDIVIDHGEYSTRSYDNGGEIWREAKRRGLNVNMYLKKTFG